MPRRRDRAAMIDLAPAGASVISNAILYEEPRRSPSTDGNLLVTQPPGTRCASPREA